VRVFIRSNTLTRRSSDLRQVNDALKNNKGLTMTKNIFIFEDHRLFGKLMTDCLETGGYKVSKIETITDSKIAFSLVKETKPEELFKLVEKHISKSDNPATHSTGRSGTAGKKRK
jgi:hypothetical protein